MATVADLSDPTKPPDSDLTIKPSGHLQRVTPYYWNSATNAFEAATGTNGQVTVSGNSVTLTDKSIASATGASQTLIAANTTRLALTIVNPVSSTTDWTINPTGGVAAADTPPAITLRPGDVYSPAKVPMNAITGIGTAASKLTVLEG